MGRKRKSNDSDDDAELVLHIRTTEDARPLVPIPSAVKELVSSDDEDEDHSLSINSTFATAFDEEQRKLALSKSLWSLDSFPILISLFRSKSWEESR